MGRVKGEKKFTLDIHVVFYESCYRFSLCEGFPIALCKCKDYESDLTTSRATSIIPSILLDTGVAVESTFVGRQVKPSAILLTLVHFMFRTSRILFISYLNNYYKFSLNFSP